MTFTLKPSTLNLTGFNVGKTSEFSKSAKSESIFDWWDTPKSQDPELIRAARTKVNLEAIWSNWSGWSDCETKYGESTRFRKCRRSVSQSKSSDNQCLGLSRETRECSKIYCNKNDCTKENFQNLYYTVIFLCSYFLKSTISRLMKKPRKQFEISKKSIRGEIFSELKISTSHMLTQMKCMGLETKKLLAFTITLKILFKD